MNSEIYIHPEGHFQDLKNYINDNRDQISKENFENTPFKKEKLNKMPRLDQLILFQDTNHYRNWG